MISSIVFGKKLSEITLEDLVSFFSTPQAENDKLEFKSFVNNRQIVESADKSKKADYLKKIKETICGFLNTDGGLLIWGAPKGQGQGSREKSFYGELSPVELDFGKDRIMNILASSINPTPNRIQFHSIEVEKGKHIYMFDVAPSDYAPHQVSGTYFMRLDGQTKFAPHQYVDALIKKVNVPRLSMRFQFGKSGKLGDLVYVCFNITITNEAKYVNERNVTLKLYSTGQLLAGTETFKSYTPDKWKEIHITDILYYGEPVRLDFILLTSHNKGRGIRRIPVQARLTGELSPMVRSFYGMEMNFWEDQNATYDFLDIAENTYGNEVRIEDEMRYVEVRTEFFEHEFLHSESAEQIIKWSEG